MHPKTRKRYLKWLSWLAVVCFVVPLVKVIAFFKAGRMQVQKLKSREAWLAAYLRLEYGEDEADPASLKASDLKYLGRFNIDGIPTDYWEYPTSGKPAYVTIAETENGDAASMTDDPPTGEQLS